MSLNLKFYKIKNVHFANNKIEDLELKKIYSNDNLYLNYI